MSDRIAIVDGLRSPMCKSGGVFKGISADDLGVMVMKELIARTEIDPKLVDSVIIGNVAQPANAANIARVIALKSGLPIATPAHTVHRNCASGMEAISSAALNILHGDAEIILAGGTESMSNIPFLYGPNMRDFFTNLMKAKTLAKKLQVITSFRLKHLKPVIGLMEGLTDPVCGLIMGKTAENLANDFSITRQEQDQFALESHQKAIHAIQKGIMAEEVQPIPIPPYTHNVQHLDDGPRQEQTMEALAKLKPYFVPRTGTVTVGNACPITDGAAMVLVMKESKAKELGYKPLGFLKEFAYHGVDPSRMGLGPIFSTHKVLKKTGLKMKDVGLIEINEAFAAQVIANERAFASKAFSEKHFGESKELGAIDRSILNVNGGAVALGHPVGMTGTRLVITLLKEMKRRQVKIGLATLCVGGGQGGAFIMELA